MMTGRLNAFLLVLAGLFLTSQAALFSNEKPSGLYFDTGSLSVELNATAADENTPDSPDLIHSDLGQHASGKHFTGFFTPIIPDGRISVNYEPIRAPPVNLLA